MPDKTIPRRVSQTNCLFAALRHFRQYYSEMNLASVMILLVIAMRDFEYTGKDLEARLGVTPASIQRSLASLKRQSLIEQRVHPDDSRLRLYAATAQGHRLVAQALVELEPLSA